MLLIGSTGYYTGFPQFQKYTLSIVEWDSLIASEEICHASWGVEEGSIQSVFGQSTTHLLQVLGVAFLHGELIEHPILLIYVCSKRTY